MENLLVTRRDGAVVMDVVSHEGVTTIRAASRRARADVESMLRGGFVDYVELAYGYRKRVVASPDAPNFLLQLADYFNRRGFVATLTAQTHREPSEPNRLRGSKPAQLRLAIGIASAPPVGANTFAEVRQRKARLFIGDVTSVGAPDSRIGEPRK